MTQCIMAFMISDLTLIFGFVSAFSEATVSFVFPGMFFVIGAKVAKKDVPRYQIIGALAFSGFGIAYFFVSNYFNLMKMI